MSIAVPLNKKVSADLALDVGTYIDGMPGAGYVRLGQNTVYFLNHIIVGVRVGDVMYTWAPDGRQPSANKRVKEAVRNRQGIKQIIETDPRELSEKAGDAIMLMATKLIDKRLKNE